jgi:hypothetical protein
MSITFRISKDDNKNDKHMSITFRIGKDDITRNKTEQILGKFTTGVYKPSDGEHVACNTGKQGRYVFSNCSIENMPFEILGEIR